MSWGAHKYLPGALDPGKDEHVQDRFQVGTSVIAEAITKIPDLSPQRIFRTRFVVKLYTTPCPQRLLAGLVHGETWQNSL